MNQINLEAIAPGLATGGARARTVTQLVNMPGRWCLYGHLGQMAHELDAGGPIDAPDLLPAGSVTNIHWCNTGGEPMVRQSEYYREGQRAVTVCGR